MKVLQHFLLTRFNILLWRQDKEGGKVRTKQWLEHRFTLFEQYCLPSIKNQTCRDFEWIVLFDSSTPEIYKAKIEGYQKECKQLIPIFVEPQNGRFFADIFRREIIKRIKAQRVLTTYLDNDDALSVSFVEDIQRRLASVDDETFINYNDGFQFYEEDGYLMKIHYPTNHFVSVVEKGEPSTLKGIFGYGGHSYIEKIKDVRIEHVKGLAMWCEVVHAKNMINDAYFIKSKMVRDSDLLKNEYAIDVTVKYGVGIYCLKFLPRYMKTFVRRAKHRLFGKKW